MIARENQKTTRPRGRPKRLVDMDCSPRTTELLVSAAIAQFADHGFDGVSLRQIAASAGVDASLIIHRFGSKLGLWQAAIDQLADRLVTTLQEISNGAPTDIPPIERLDAYIHALVDVVCDTPELAAFILCEIVRQNDRSDYSHRRLVSPIRDYVYPLIAIATDEEDAPDPDFLFFALTGAIVTSVAARQHLVRFSTAAEDDQLFRETLRHSISVRVSARLGHHHRAAKR